MPVAGSVGAPESGNDGAPEGGNGGAPEGGGARGGRAGTVAMLFATGVLWSLGGVFIKTTDANPFVISGIRSLAATVCMFAYLRFRPKFVFTRAQIVGALCYAATVTSFVVANKLTTAANAILLQYSAPLFVAALSWVLLKEKPFWYDFILMGGVAVGLAFLFSGSSGPGSAAGNIVSLASGFFYGSMMVSLKLHKTGSRVETVILGNLVAVLIGIPFMIIYPFNLSILPPLIFIGAVQIAAPYALFAKAAESASALDLALIPMIEPLLSPVWVYIATGEKPATVTYIGGAILLGVIAARSAIMIKIKNRS